MVLHGQLKLFGLAVFAALAAFLMALAVAPAVQAADVSQDQSAPFAMQENDDDDNGILDDDDENGVTDDDNGVTDDDNGVTDDDDAVTDDDDEVMPDDDEEIAPAETGGAGLLGTGSGFALGGMLLGFGALLALITAGRFATREE